MFQGVIVLHDILHKYECECDIYLNWKLEKLHTPITQKKNILIILHRQANDDVS